LQIFIGSGRFPYEHQLSVRVSYPEDDLVPECDQMRAPATGESCLL
jgi:hypothetical protein